MCSSWNYRTVAPKPAKNLLFNKLSRCGENDYIVGEVLIKK